MVLVYNDLTLSNVLLAKLSSNTAYSVLLTNLLTSPLTILAISKNVASSVDVKDFLASVKSILNL